LVTRFGIAFVLGATLSSLAGRLAAEAPREEGSGVFPEVGVRSPGSLELEGGVTYLEAEGLIASILEAL